MQIKIEHMIDEGCGGRKNQDAFWIKREQHYGKEAVLGVVCDGIGGSFHGEVASAKVIGYLQADFWKKVDTYIQKNFTIEQIGMELDRILYKVNEELYRQGKRTGKLSGTTVTLCFLSEESYWIANVGDSRAYWCQKDALYRTKDHTVEGSDGNRHMLWQGIGMQEELFIEHYSGNWNQEFSILLATDGAYRSFDRKEIMDYCIKGNLRKMKRQAKKRKEQDNMTGVRIQLR